MSINQLVVQDSSPLGEEIGNDEEEFDMNYMYEVNLGVVWFHNFSIFLIHTGF